MILINILPGVQELQEIREVHFFLILLAFLLAQYFLAVLLDLLALIVQGNMARKFLAENLQHILVRNIHMDIHDIQQGVYQKWLIRLQKRDNPTQVFHCLHVHPVRQPVYKHSFKLQIIKTYPL